MAYLFQASILTGSGGYDVTGPISASTTITAVSFHGSGASLTGISADAVDISGSTANDDLNLVATDRFDESGKASLAGGAAKILVFNPSTKALKCSGSISGSGQLSGQNFAGENGSITAAGIVSGSGAASFGGGVTALYGNISASAELQGQDLKIGNATVISELKAVQNVLTVSGSGQLSGQNLVLENGSITAAGVVSGSAAAIFGGGISVPYGEVSASAALEGKNLDLENGSITAAGIISGSGTATIGGGITALYGSVSASAALVGQSLEVEDGSITSAGAISASAGLTLRNGSISSVGVVSGSGAATLGGGLTVRYGAITASAGLSGQSLTVAGYSVIAAGGAITLGEDAQVDVTCNGVLKIQNGFTINYKLTGSGAGTSLQGNCAPLEQGDTFVVVNNSTTDATVELPNTTALGWASGRVITIKRSPDMSADVILSGALGAPDDLLDGEDATLRLDSAGAAVNLIGSGSSGANAFWLLY
jgi:fibronectin-binding autotransporter adhesin